MLTVIICCLLFWLICIIFLYNFITNEILKVIDTFKDDKEYGISKERIEQTENMFKEMASMKFYSLLSFYIIWSIPLTIIIAPLFLMFYISDRK